MWTYNSLYLSHSNTNRASVEAERNKYRGIASAARLGAQNTRLIDNLVKKTEPIGRYATSLNRYYKRIMLLSNEIRQLFNQISQESVRYDQGSPTMSQDQLKAKSTQLTGKVNALNTAISDLSYVLCDAGKSGTELADVYIDVGDLIGLNIKR